MIIKEHVPIPDITTMRIGGHAFRLIEIEDSIELPRAIEYAKEHDLNYYFIGSGANLIGTDRGFRGVLIKNNLMGIDILEKTDNKLSLKVAGGEDWDHLSHYVSNLNYTGAEAMAKIPGTVGAAPVQNIGAYGQEIKDVLTKVDVFDTKTGEFCTLENKDLDFSYRHSIFNHGENAGRYFILYVYFEFTKGEIKPPFYISLQNYVEENSVTDFSPANIYKIISRIRAAKIPTPDLYPSAGSFFKNIILTPEEAEIAKNKNIPVWPNGDGNFKINSGWLLEAAGLSGKIFHGFKVNETASLILLNVGARHYSELTAARAEICDIIKEKFGYDLEQEPVELPYD